MLTWSSATLLLAFQVIGIIVALYIAFAAYQQSPKWGVFFFLSTLAFVGLERYVEPLVAGLVVIASQIYFIHQPYTWKTLGRFYIYLIICWGGVTTMHVREYGWVPVMFRPIPQVAVAQAGDPVAWLEDKVPVDGGEIWYRRGGTGTGTPVVLVHGGPGVGSFAMKPFEALGDDRPVVRYDQLGAGKSTWARDTAVFTIPHYVAELDSLRATLGYDKVHLVSHAWGTILALEYYRAHPDRVASLTLASPVLSAADWNRDARRLLATLPDTAQKIITHREALGDYDAPDYLDAANEYYRRYVWMRPSEMDQDSLQKTARVIPRQHMWGPTEFAISGTLRSYDATRLLRTVKVPTLYTVGEFDEATVATVTKFAARTPGARLEVIADAAHYAMWDNPGALLTIVREFLRHVDNPPPPPADH
jgi:proline-specific peptidase